jgi:prophage DNA circulation protein
MGVINKNKLPNASFKDVPFLWQSDSIQNLGRNTVTHNFPDAPRQRARFVEDLGASNDTLNVVAQIDYSEDFSLRDNFLNALNSEGSGTLILPTEDPQEVSVKTYSRDNRLQALGIVTFNITFEQTEVNSFPETVKGSTGEVTALKDNVLDQTSVYLSNSWEDVKGSKVLFDSAVDKVVNSINDRQLGIRKVASSVRSQGDGFSEFSASLNSIVSSAFELVQSPSGLADELKTSFNNLELAYDRSEDLFSASKGLFGFKAGDISVVGDSSIQKKKIINQNLLNDLIAANALVIAYNAAVQIEFNNTTEIDEVSQDLENGFQLINPDIDDSIYQNLLLTRQEANSIFETLRISLPTITTLDIGLNPQPLITIVYSIYGSIDNYDLIDSLDNFTDVTSISGNINIISA